MKKWILYVGSTLLILAIMVQLGWLQMIGINRISFGGDRHDKVEQVDTQAYITEGEVAYRVKAEGEYFYVYSPETEQWEKIFWKGVNIGAGKPGLFPGELTISYEDYYRWFGYIAEMNCNCIRVYTTMRPQFYQALYDYNSQTENPLYLFHGVWMDEDDIATYADVYAENSKIKNEFIQDALNCVDVIMGNAVLPERAGFASGTYTANVSKWFAGWILGIENDPKFILNTNESNPDKNTYEGEYLYTYGSTPFEAFFCEAGDKVIAHMTEQYGIQCPVAFVNWITTDPLTHPEEPHEDEDLITFNTESIRSRDTYQSNLFASYHVYPYYPDSMNYQKDYLSYVDEDGKVNTYKAYLEDLKLAHTVPILIAEFGIPTSRGVTHRSVMGYNQGGVDETEQGEMLADMFRSIYDSHYAGAITFSWQDEWFKRTWNNVNYDVADSRPYWSNIQTSEQNFGILAFDPGAKSTVCVLDGLDNEWDNKNMVASNDYGQLYMNSDERYVYFMVDIRDDYDFKFETDTLLIPIDSIGEQGNTKMNDTGAVFDKEVDFVLWINGKDHSRIVVDSYYDAHYFLYGEQYKMIDAVGDIATKNSGRFNHMMLCTGYEMTIPTTNQMIGFDSYETGKLTYGNGDPSSEDYQSLSDFIYNEEQAILEIRIPWQLLNVMDPSTKQIMSDFYTEQNITPVEFEGFTVGFGILQENNQTISLNGTYTYDTWKTPTYHERLKPAYYELQHALKELN